MSQARSYQELNLAPGATELEIKAAFRRLAKESHPDSAAAGGDPRKFQRAHEAYQDLLAKARANRRKEMAVNGVQYRFLSQTKKGLDLYYDLAVTKGLDDFTLTLPWLAKEVCPRCFGEGRTLTQLNQGAIYRPTACPRCEGLGHTERLSHITVTVTEAMAKAGKIRLKGAGDFDVKAGERGDLYLSLNFVERLSEMH
ncbi:MAG: DnaJ domain-containing protein [Deltaproteobacteria bacterium]|jgi:DnaJ-class molecular chaperone|nr:DnaJ domain-containing protein [Deltaproteobacteria bacterium]